MAMLNIPISAIDGNGDLISERVDFSQPMPKGNYSVVAKEAEIKRNQKDTTNYLRGAFQVIAGPWKGKWVARHSSGFLSSNWNPRHARGYRPPAK